MKDYIQVIQFDEETSWEWKSFVDCGLNLANQEILENYSKIVQSQLKIGRIDLSGQLLKMETIH